MANVFYDYGIVDTELDINLLVRNATAQYFYDNINADINAKPYQDVAVAQYSVNGVYFSDIFGGYGLAVNSQNQITDGVVTGYVESIWNGRDWIPMWGVEDIAYSAVALANTAYTSSTADEQAVIRELLNGNDTFRLSGFNDQAHGYAGDDTIEAGYGFDTIYGGLGNDYIQGGFNGDRIYGEDGNDDLRGGNGLDLIVGGAGNDTIRGAKGTDTLTGGDGADVFIFEKELDGVINVDTITDFVSGTDRIDLSLAVFGNAGAVGSHVGLNQYIKYNAATGVLSYDADGSGPAAGVAFAVLGADSHPTTVGTDFWIVA